MWKSLFSIDNGTLVRYNGDEEHAVIPAGVTCVGERAFYRCLHLESVVMPNAVQDVGNLAFAFCIHLNSITIPEGVTAIGNGAFIGCKDLGTILLPESVRSIGERAFEGCQSLESITIPAGVERINTAAFRWCKALKKIIFSGKSICISDWAFEGCRDIEIVVPPKSSIQPEDHAFSDTSALILEEYIDGIERMGTIKQLRIRKTPLQSILTVPAQVLAVKGFLTARDTSIFEESVVQSYEGYLKHSLSKLIRFILEDDTEFIVSRLCASDTMDRKTMDRLMNCDLPIAAKAALLEYGNKGTGQTSIDNEFSL